MDTKDTGKPSGIEEIEFTSKQSMPASLFDNTEFGVAMARERGVSSHNFTVIVNDIDRLIKEMNELRTKVLALAASENRR